MCLGGCQDEAYWKALAKRREEIKEWQRQQQEENLKYHGIFTNEVEEEIVDQLTVPDEVVLETQFQPLQVDSEETAVVKPRKPRGPAKKSTA